MVEGRHGEQAHGDLLLALDRLCQRDATRDICPLLSCAVSLQCAHDENVHHVRDFHVTLLHLLGLNDNKLTYFHEGRYKQLSQVGGQVIKELLA